MASFDCAIIGGGPAGLSAALALSRQARKVAIFDSQHYRNRATSYMHNVIGFDHVAPADFRARSLEELHRRYGSEMVQRIETEIAEIRPSGSGFVLVDKKGKGFSARKVILATGARDVYPQIEGFAECWGRNIYHCLFCHGYEEKGSAHAGLLIGKPVVEQLLAHMAYNAALALNFASNVTVFTNGMEEADLAKVRALPVISGLIAKGKVLGIDNRLIKRFSAAREQNHAREHSGEKEHDEHEELEIQFEDSADACRLAFLVCPVRATLSEASARFATQLGLELSPSMNEIAVKSMFNESSMRGVFVGGDVAALVKAAVPAMAAGSMAGAGVAFQIATDDATAV